ncbi:DUF2334 domain-containing protein [Halogeometricum borinquense]|nr:DUF2334 domain-containing protein [Halogeometricum borinquense]
MSIPARRLRSAVVVLVVLVIGASVGVGGVTFLDTNWLFPTSDSTSPPAATPDATADAATQTPAAPTTTPRPSSAANTTWKEYQLVAVFRNDDIKPNPDPTTMQAVDRVFADENVPVTNAVIPFPGGEPISSSKETCSYLRELRRDNPTTFEFALHGYTHEKRTEFYGASEFGSVPSETQQEWITVGTRELTVCTGVRPTTFVPPMNTYDKNTTRAVAASNLTVISGGSWFTEPYYGERGVFRASNVVHVGNTTGYVANWTTMETKSRSDLRADFDKAYAEGGTYAMMLHYPHFDTAERRSDLRALLRYAKSHDGVRFMTVGEVGSRLSNETMERTDEGWRVLESER